MTPNLNPNSDDKILQIFCKPFLQNPENESVLPFQKPLRTQNLIPTQMQKFYKFFRNQFFCNPTIQTLPQMLYLFEIFTLPFTLYPPHFTLSPYHEPFTPYTLPLSLLPLPIYLSCDFIDTSLVFEARDLPRFSMQR